MVKLEACTAHVLDAGLPMGIRFEACKPVGSLLKKSDIQQAAAAELVGDRIACTKVGTKHSDTIHSVGKADV